MVGASWIFSFSAIKENQNLTTFSFKFWVFLVQQHEILHYLPRGGHHPGLCWRQEKVGRDEGHDGGWDCATKARTGGRTKPKLLSHGGPSCALYDCNFLLLRWRHLQRYIQPLPLSLSEVRWFLRHMHRSHPLFINICKEINLWNISYSKVTSTLSPHSVKSLFVFRTILHLGQKSLSRFASITTYLAVFPQLRRPFKSTLICEISFEGRLMLSWSNFSLATGLKDSWVKSFGTCLSKLPFPRQSVHAVPADGATQKRKLTRRAFPKLLIQLHPWSFYT